MFCEVSTDLYDTSMRTLVIIYLIKSWNYTIDITQFLIPKKLTEFFGIPKITPSKE